MIGVDIVGPGNYGSVDITYSLYKLGYPELNSVTNTVANNSISAGSIGSNTDQYKGVDGQRTFFGAGGSGGWGENPGKAADVTHYGAGGGGSGGSYRFFGDHDGDIKGGAGAPGGFGIYW